MSFTHFLDSLINLMNSLRVRHLHVRELQEHPDVLQRRGPGDDRRGPFGEQEREERGRPVLRHKHRRRRRRVRLLPQRHPPHVHASQPHLRRVCRPFVEDFGGVG